eukprot:TRINITY_DN979_c0_g1_i1.p1 TRINITY_DN979_c0_g1~~TRINITY_DN979_c0_g1_i1.p1  ORF type:complete len:328 (-),score=65.15 TRINITY_DN979_c0_g1_i1:230-1213(-)
MSNNNEDSNKEVVLYLKEISNSMKGISEQIEQLSHSIAKVVDLKGKQKMEPRFASTGRIKLDVGGTLFTTSMETLTSFKGSFFDAMFSGRFPLKKEEDGAIFIDRNGKHFGYILDFMRGTPPSLEHFSKREINELRTEAEYYQLTDLVHLISPPPPQPVMWRWKEGPGYTVSNDGFTVTKTDVSDWSVTALVQQSIDVSQRGKHTWNVRIDKGNLHMIGVANCLLDQTALKNYKNSMGWFICTHNSIVFHSTGSLPYPRTEQPLPIGSVVGVHLDLDQRTLSFSVNGEMKGVAVSDFPVDKFPRLTLASCLYYINSSLTVLNDLNDE